EFAGALRQALVMPAEEQERRMRRLRQQMEDNNIYRWAGMLLSAAGKLVGGRHEENTGHERNGARPPVLVGAAPSIARPSPRPWSDQGKGEAGVSPHRPRRSRSRLGRFFKGYGAPAGSGAHRQRRPPVTGVAFDLTWGHGHLSAVRG